MLFIGSTVLTNRYVKAAVKAREEARYLKEEIALKTMLQKSDMEVVRLAAAIESMDTLVLLTDLEGEIFYLNPAAEKGFGFSSKELVSTNIELLFAAANPPGTFSSILAETAEGGWEGDCFILNKDNAEIPVHLIASPVKERSGNNISMTWSMQDLTETKELQYKLIQYEKMRALGVLAAGVAHDFNNILAIILTNTQILLSDLKSDKFDDARFKQKLEAVQEATRRAVETVRRLKIYASQEEIGQRVMNLNEIISEAIFITEPQWKKMKTEEGTPVIIETSLNPLPDIRCTHLELLEVFINIIVNSVEAMPNGGTITIITRRIGEYVVASISDTGQGMEDEVREQIFDLFFSTKGPARSGLGLSTALSTIQRHRGQIKVWSKQGAGATFDILLPVFRRTDKLKPDFKNILSDSGAEILVIEDDVSTCDIICSLLSSNGYAVCCKNDDASGLEKFKRKQFDLVLTGVTAGDSKGLNLPEEIKQIKPSTPVIAMSSWSISEKKEDRLKESGIDFILAKPIESFDLFNTVERALQRK